MGEPENSLTLLAHLSCRFHPRMQELAVEALAHILNRHPDSRGGLDDILGEMTEANGSSSRRSSTRRHADHPWSERRSIAALGGRVTGLKFRGRSGSSSSDGAFSGVLRGQPRAGFPEGGQGEGVRTASTAGFPGLWRLVWPGTGSFCPGFGGFGGIRAGRNGCWAVTRAAQSRLFRLLAPIAGRDTLPEACLSPVSRWDQAWPGVRAKRAPQSSRTSSHVLASRWMSLG